jgi:hypothetical protein
MVGVPGDQLQNTAPPTVAILALASLQTGVALLLRRRILQWLERPRFWARVAAVNSAVMTVFLWHMVPVVAVAALLYPTGLMPQPQIGSAAWLALRPVWIGALVVPLTVLVVTLGRLEPALRHQPRTPRVRSGPGGFLLILGVAAVSAGLALFTLDGFHGEGPVGLPIHALATYGMGVAAIGISRWK